MLANGGNLALVDHNGNVNGSYSLLKHFDIKLNGKKVYDCNDANHAVNIKNLLEYSPSYADKTATMEDKILGTIDTICLNFSPFPPLPSKQCWDEETLLGQGKVYRGAQTTTLLRGEGERGKN